MNITTACPLDCYDACEISVEDDLLKGAKFAHTAGFLCSHLKHYESYETITLPRYKGKEITLTEALAKLKEMLECTEVLHYRGHGNFGLMQEVTDHFFSSLGATLTDGSLCDGAGAAGVVLGRGTNKNMPLSEIAKSDVVIVWGRNPHATSSHLLPLLKNKTLIVIDPIKTKIAKMADLHIQIKPHGDFLLALFLTQLLKEENDTDEEYLREYGNGFDDYCELLESANLYNALEEIDVSPQQIEFIRDTVLTQKVAIVCGLGIQKYGDGADVMRAIDALALALGLFGKEGCGVAYLGNSKEGIKSPFYTKAKKVSRVNTEFSDYECVFIQGANPLSQMPDSLRVAKSISKVKNVVYFGLYENETSEIADLVIPAKSFLYKKDIRTSYSHNTMMPMPKIKDCDIGISEYDLTAYLCKEFGIELEEESFYLKHFKNFSIQKMDGVWHVENREDIPYKNGFDTGDDEFVFLDRIDRDFNMKEGLFLLTPKSEKSLNSQFKREKNVFINSSHSFKNGEVISISSSVGSVSLEVKLNDDLRDDCVLIYSATPGVNNLTSSLHSFEGKSAIYQNEKVKINK